MQLSDIVQRPARPEPWSEGVNIPWHDPALSARMPKEHLPQEYDGASRRAAQRALAPGGLLLLKPHPFAVIRRLGAAPATWYASGGGDFRDMQFFSALAPTASEPPGDFMAILAHGA
jgi:hypothetical protein